jgi:hypothetical protein
MNKYGKRLFAVLTAVAMLSLAAGTAGANNLRTSEREAEILFATLTMTSDLGGIRVVCEVEVLGRFHESTIRKVERTLIGYVNHAVARRCSEGGATVTQASLPWHMTYETFAGRLPNITQTNLLLRGAEFEIEAGSISCHTEGRNVNQRLHMAVSGGVVTGVEIRTSDAAFPLSGLCAFGGRAHFQGNGRVGNLALTANITLTLI